jgi:hypothetical protein
MGLAAGLTAAADTEANASKEDERIAELIEKLGNAKFSERESARRELESIGMPALEALRRAAKSSDLERSRRAGDIVRVLEEKASTAQILAPVKVRLHLNNTPVLDAIKDLEKQSRYPIRVQGDLTALIGRKVMLDTGVTSFWEALDQLCAAAGLVETAPPSSQPLPRTFRVPAIKLRPALPGGGLPVVPPARPAPKGPALQIKDREAGVQVQAAQLPQAPPAPPPVPAVRWTTRSALVRTNTGEIYLTAGSPKKVPTCYAGAVRIRLLPPAAGVKRAGETAFVLEAAAEPRLENFSLTAAPRIDRALDDRGQDLSLALDPMPPANADVPPAPLPAMGAPAVWFDTNPVQHNLRSTVRLKLGAKEAKTLKELKGTLNAQALTSSEPLVTMDDIFNAAGKIAKGASGALIEVKAVDKLAGGDIQLRVRVERPPDANAIGNAVGGIAFAGGNIQVQQIQIVVRGGGGNAVVGGFISRPADLHNGLPVLLDKDGKSYDLVSLPSRSMQANGRVLTQEATMVFRPRPGQGEPARLVLNGQRMATFSVPFSFRDVPLP